MNILGHLMIAISVKKTVFQQTGARLNLTGFLYGNILPDISAKYSRNPHFFTKSLSYVLDCSKRLRTNLDIERLSSYPCSLGAGVITHYLSDFFCYAHSERCPYSICQHHWYELCMLRRFGNGLLFCRECKPDPPSDMSSLGPFIRRRMNEYDKIHDKKQDFYFALKVSSDVVIGIVNQARCHAEDGLPGNVGIRSFALR